MSKDKPIWLDEAAFHYAFTNTLDQEKSRAAWEAECVPESRRVGAGPTTDVAKIDFARERGPLLMIAGEKDHIIPAALNRKNFERYEGPSKTDFKELAGRDHFLIGSDGWREVADYAADWLGA